MRFLRARLPSAFAPVFTYFLANREIGLAGAGIIALNILLVILHLPGWPCPIKTTLGIPCPGCGLSAAMASLLEGHWQASLSEHAFAPLLLFSLFILVAVNMLPETARRQAIQRIGSWETTTGFGFWGLAALLIYWGLRLSRIL
jgi:hypothetical protein